MFRDVLLALLSVLLPVAAAASDTVAESSIKAVKPIKKTIKTPKAVITYECHGGKTGKIIVHSTGPGKFVFVYDREVCANEWSSES